MGQHVYDTIVFGSGFVSLGYAATHENTLIIERTELIEKDFSAALNPGKNWDTKAKNKETDMLIKNLTDAGLIENDKADVVTFPPFICDYVKKNDFKILLLTEVLSIEKKGDLFAVSVYNNEGIDTLFAKKILDTTAEGIYSDGVDILKKSLNVLSFNQREDFEILAKKAFGEHTEVVEGKRENERFVRVPLGTNEDIIAARDKINKGWLDFLAGEESKIAMIAFAFEYNCNQTYKKIDENWYRLVSCNFDNGIIAFDAGVDFSFEEVEE